MNFFIHNHYILGVKWVSYYNAYYREGGLKVKDIVIHYNYCVVVVIFGPGVSCPSPSSNIFTSLINVPQSWGKAGRPCLLSYQSFSVYRSVQRALSRHKIYVEVLLLVWIRGGCRQHRSILPEFSRTSQIPSGCPPNLSPPRYSAGSLRLPPH